MDHLIYAGPDLDLAVARVQELLGVQAVPGGQHPGVGTRNALVSFGGKRYLEIIAPDPEQPEPSGPRWFGIDHLEEPRLVTWCARADDLDDLVGRAARAGVELGAVTSGGRRRPDGSELRWRVTDPTTPRAGGVIPFFIDWLDSPHPGEGTGQGVSVLELRARHPDAAAVERRFEALGLTVPVDRGEAPGLTASIQTAEGVVELA